MSKTAAMRSLRRILNLAVQSKAQSDSSYEAAPNPHRRRTLQAMGAAALSPICSSINGAMAAPRSNGNIGIVGAGLAGLSCAYQLAAKGVTPSVYEASQRAGGRCWSLRNFFPGQVAERGGEFIDTTHSTMRGLANAFGLHLEDVTKEPGEVFYFFDGRHYTEAQVVNEFRAFVPAIRADLRSLGKPTAEKFSPTDRQLDLTSLADYLESRGAGPLIRQVVESAYTVEYGRELSHQSCLNLLLFIHADRRSKFHPFGVFSDERFHVLEGNDAIPQAMANVLGDRMVYGHSLLRARRLESGHIQLAFATADGTVERQHDAVVFALPFSVLRNVELDASLSLPAWKLQAISAFQYGTNSKMMIGFDGRPWHTLHHSNGASYSDLQNHQSTWESNARASGVNGLLTDYSGGARGAFLDPTQAQLHAAEFLSDLDRVYPGARQFARVVAGQYVVHVENWSQNPLALGAYTCNAPGYFTSIAGTEGKPVGNVFFAGEHTDSFYAAQGFLEGAANSGLRAAGEVAAFLKK